MTVNVTQLEHALLKKIDATTNPGDLLILTKAIKQLQIGQVFSVGSFENLPSLSEVEAGSLYFIEADRQLYISRLDAYAWKPLINTSATTLWSWGGNSSGVNGDNSSISRSSPVSVVGYFGDWCDISVSNNHAIALRSNGTLWVWGEGGQGQLGISCTLDRSSPVQLNSLTEYSWCRVSAASGRSGAIRCDGTLWTWGSNAGVLGDGTVADKSSPISVLGGINTWSLISMGDSMALGIASGVLRTWGNNNCGQLGDNTRTVRSSPVIVVGGFSDWCNASAFSNNAAAIRSNGELWIWGGGSSGILGDNTVVPKSSPVSIVGGLTNWCQVSVSASVVAAVNTNGEIWTWGCGRCGGLGDNNTINRSSPVSISGGFTNWCTVAIGDCFGVAIRTNGEMWSWGLGTSGRLGDNTIITKSSPVSVAGNFTDWSVIAVAGDESAAIRTTPL